MSSSNFGVPTDIYVVIWATAFLYATIQQNYSYTVRKVEKRDPPFKNIWGNLAVDLVGWVLAFGFVFWSGVGLYHWLWT